MSGILGAALGLPWGFEPSHRPFSLARRFVRDFGAVIRIDVVDVIDRGHDRPMSRIITSEFIGDQPARFPYGQKTHAA